MSMKRPGDWLRSLAARVCSPRTMEQLVDPVIADLQCEHAAAVGRGHVWRSRGIRLSGYVAFWKAVALHAEQRCAEGAYGRASADNWALGRTVGFSLAAIVALTALLELPVLQHVSLSGRAGDGARVLLYLVPQATSLAIPAGLALGILCGLRGRIAGRRTRRAIVVLAIACSLATFTTMAWIVPRANQAFRVLMVGQDIAKGPAELTFHELGARIDELNARGLTRDGAALALHLHVRRAFSGAPLVFGVFALGLSGFNRGRWRSVLVGLAVVITCVAYFMLVSWLRAVALTGSLGPVAAAWIPNLLVALIAAALYRRDPYRSDSFASTRQA